jgi:hypothetical protein
MFVRVRMACLPMHVESSGLLFAVLATTNRAIWTPALVRLEPSLSSHGFILFPCHTPQRSCGVHGQRTAAPSGQHDGPGYAGHATTWVLRKGYSGVSAASVAKARKMLESCENRDHQALRFGRKKPQLLNTPERHVSNMSKRREIPYSRSLSTEAMSICKPRLLTKND